MARISAVAAGGSQVVALLDTVAVSELGEQILSDPMADEGYRVLVGSVPGQLLLFSSYRDHPHADIQIRAALRSSAAGRYQVMEHFWPYYKGVLELPDFGPESQDRYAIQQFKENGALAAIQGGKFEYAVMRIAHIWASLPGAGYGQHENRMAALAAVFKSKGGVIA